MDRIKNTNLSEKNEYGNNITDYELLTKLPWKKNTEKNPWKKVDDVIKKTKKKCKKWLAIDARHCLRMKKMKKGSMVEIDIRICVKKEKEEYLKEYKKNIPTMC